jgi:ABC-type polysaccharide/polyol phosphate transport system ATPase subunit
VADSPLVVRVRDAHATFRVYEAAPRVADVLARGTVRRRVLKRIEALRGINLEVVAGESIGVIGANGAGKSTLLRAIAGLQELDRGQIETAGNAQLLGVQAALRAPWTARESIETGLIALGLTRADALERIEQVAAFAGLTDRVEQPVSTLSTGMRARLYFSISTEVAGDILLVDEALATGDAKFREAAIRRMRAHLDAAQAIMIVSHSMATIQEIATRAIWIDEGRIQSQGETEMVIDAYQRSMTR